MQLNSLLSKISLLNFMIDRSAPAGRQSLKDSLTFLRWQYKTLADLVMDSKTS
jgi:hypothetical protein